MEFDEWYKEMWLNRPQSERTFRDALLDAWIAGREAEKIAQTSAVDKCNGEHKCLECGEEVTRFVHYGCA